MNGPGRFIAIVLFSLKEFGIAAAWIGAGFLAIELTFYLDINRHLSSVTMISTGAFCYCVSRGPIEVIRSRHSRRMQETMDKALLDHVKTGNFEYHSPDGEHQPGTFSPPMEAEQDPDGVLRAHHGQYL